MADLTTLGVAALSGGLGLSSGLLTARYQRRSAEDQRRDAVVALRRQSYHGFLDAIRELTTLLASGREFTTDDFHGWLNRLNHAYNDVRLSGGETTIEEAKRLVEIIGLVDQGRLDDVSGDPIGDKLRRAYSEQADDLHAVEQRLAAAMQADVTPTHERR